MAARKKKNDATAQVGEVVAPDEALDEGKVVQGEVLKVTQAKKPRKARGARAKVVVESTIDAEPEGDDAPLKGSDDSGDPVALDEPQEPAVEDLDDVVADLDPALALAPIKEARGVSSRDPLGAYMAEVTRHPLLTREQEVELGRKLRDTGDVRAAYTMVASNLRLVVKLAHEYHRNPLSLLDLVQEGNIGLMQAVKKFDPERGVKLASYAAWWIRAYILRYIMDNWKMVKLGTTEAQRKLFFKLRQEQQRLLQQGFEVTPKLLAERLNVTEQDVVEMDQRLGHDEVSLDAPAYPGDDNQTSRADRLLPTSNASTVGVDDALGNAELKALFKNKLSAFAETLNEKERFIFEKRLIADEPMTLQDIGAQYGVSRERARQIEAALIARMRTYMQSEIPDFSLLQSDDHD